MLRKSQMKKYFKNLKVVELSSVLAGPAVGMFFAELGAKVYKIENPKTGGDITRSWKLPTEKSNKKDSAYFNSVNWGKRSLFWDISKPNEFKKLNDLIKTADIVVSNYQTGTAKKLKVSYPHLKKINPKLIYAEIKGFPDERRAAYDVLLQAEAGYLSMTGTENGELVKMPVALIDVLTAHQLKEGVLIALMERNRTGKGCYVSASLFDTAISSLTNQASNWLQAKYNPEPMGLSHPNIAPYGDYILTKDKQRLVLAIGSDKQFARLCEILNEPKLSQNQKFISNQQRVKNRKELLEKLKNSSAKIKYNDLIYRLIEKDIPFAPINKVSEVVDSEYVKKRICFDKPHTPKILKTVVFCVKK